MRRHHLGLLASLVAIALVSGCSSSKTHAAAPSSSASAQPSAKPVNLFPAPADPMALARQVGLVPETHETLTHHVHAHLDVFANGAPVVVPAGIGINITDPAVKKFGTGADLGYGGIDPPCKQVCISPLHTHDTGGVLHTESASAVPNTLGQFFGEWAVPITASCLGHVCGGVKIYIDGKQVTDDPKRIQLLDQREIAVVVGPPPASIPSKGDFSQA